MGCVKWDCAGGDGAIKMSIGFLDSFPFDIKVVAVCLKIYDSFK